MDLTPYLQQDPDLKEDIPGIVEQYPALVAAREAGFDMLPSVLSHPHLLDVGPACGWSTKQLALRGYAVTCITLFEEEAVLLRALKDTMPSEEQAAAATSGVSGPTFAWRSRICHVEVGDLHEMPADWAGKFDVVRASHVLEHSPAPVVALREFARVLKPGGVLQITIPNADGYVGLGTERAFRIGNFGCHPFTPSVQTLIEMLRHPGVGLQFDSYHEIPQLNDGRLHYYHCTWMASKP